MAAHATTTHLEELVEKLIETKPLVRFHAWIIAGLVILYLVTFPFFKAPILVSVPVIVAGAFYYWRGGLIASTLALVLDLFLTKQFMGGSYQDTLLDLRNGFLIGHILVALVSIAVGYLRQVFENFFQLNKRLRSQERFLSLSNMIAKEILSPSKPDTLFNDMVNHLTNLFVADSGYIIRWDPIHEKAFLIAATHSISGDSLNAELKSNGAGITESVLQTGRVLPIEDFDHRPDDIYPLEFADISHQARSAICLPLVAREYKFGVAILAYDSPRQYTEEDKVYAERVGYQIALALWTVKQDQISLQQLKETRTLMQIGQTLGETERVGLGVVLQLIVDSARQLIPQAEKSVIHLVDTDNQSLIPQATSGFHENERVTTKLRMHIGNGAAGQVLRDGITINITDINTDPRFLQSDIRPAYRSLLVAPVQAAGNQLGTISVESEKPEAFSAHEAELLKTLGNQAG
ncbi:MAG: GAF domain-containing protein, partial [Anaerolineales bacterium]